jgi:CRISPR-associated protein Cas2
MIHIILYDIESDRARTRLAKLLERQGFTRLQYSVFAGETDRHRWQAVWAGLETFFRKHCTPADKLYAPVVETDAFEKMPLLGTPPDFDYVMNKMHTLYL